jgi:hypothetical protein
MTTVHRRQFLQATAGVVLTGGLLPAAKPRSSATHCIRIHMIGGPSQLDTFDPKPDAPSEIRGPFSTIPTRIPGVRFTELFPKLAAINDKFSMIRTMTTPTAPVHELGLQLLNTGHAYGHGTPKPSLGQLLKTDCTHLEDHPIDLGMTLDVGTMGVVQKPSALASHKTRLTTYHQYSTVFGQPSWDCHAAGGNLGCSLADYKNSVAPSFDELFSNLILTLEAEGRLASTLVIASGEFGRTPKLNGHGGRDHWTGCWTTLIAGGGVQPGRVIGTSDTHAAEPKDRPVTPQDLFATVAHIMNLQHDVPGQIISELF